MKKEIIFVKDILLQELRENVQPAADFLGEVGKVFETNFPKIKWSTAVLYSLIQEYDVCEFFMDQRKRKAAKDSGLDCGYTETSTRAIDFCSEQIKFNRNFVEASIAKDLALIKRLQEIAAGKLYLDSSKRLLTYLRTGAIYIDANGGTKIAENIDDILTDYCSVTVENSAESKFFSQFLSLREAVEKAKQAQYDLSRLTVDSAMGKTISYDAYKYDRLTVDNNIYLLSDTASWRIFIQYMASKRGTDKPRFFNRVGYPDVDLEEIYNATGYLFPPTNGLRVKYPDLYKKIAYTGTTHTIVNSLGQKVDTYRNGDTPEGVKCFEDCFDSKRRENPKAYINKYGAIICKR